MNTRVCVNCSNKKDVNSTTNRLVTESCGHVKCMECLLQEKSGCVACLNERNGEERVNTEQSACNGSMKENGVSEADVQFLVPKANRNRPDTHHIKVETVGKVKTYECLICCKKFHSRSMVVYHSYCNGQKKPYECPITDCNKSFTSLSYFRYHMRVHRDDRAFQCDVCGTSFYQKSKMIRHQMNHSQDKNYKCETCGKGFSNSTSLRRHSMTHTEERPYTCETCGQRIRDSSNYRKHIYKHQSMVVSSDGPLRRGPRPHKCPRCPQAFHLRKDLRRHTQVHSDAKPYRCKACDVERRFRRKDNLDRHIRNSHPDLARNMAAVCETPDLTQIETDNSEPNDNTKIADPVSEKKKLEILNPLPPLPQDVIEKHMTTDVAEKVKNIGIIEQEKPGINPLPRLAPKISEKINIIDVQIIVPAIDTSKDKSIDTSYILQANNARQSVIVECTDRKNPSPVPEYVHKIRKANSMRCQKDTPLPPIDPTKIIELESKACINNLDIGDIGVPKNIETYKNILYDKFEKSGEEETKATEMHWRRKMKLGINW